MRKHRTEVLAGAEAARAAGRAAAACAARLGATATRCAEEAGGTRSCPAWGRTSNSKSDRGLFTRLVGRILGLQLVGTCVANFLLKTGFTHQQHGFWHHGHVARTSANACRLAASRVSGAIERRLTQEAQGPAGHAQGGNTPRSNNNTR